MGDTLGTMARADAEAVEVLEFDYYDTREEALEARGVEGDGDEE